MDELIKNLFEEPKEIQLVSNEEERKETKDEKEELDTKLISSGTYGCIYHPGLSCSYDSKKIRDNNERKNKITKIQFKGNAAKKELHISEKIKTNNPVNYAYHFITFDNACDVEMNEIRTQITEAKTSSDKNATIELEKCPVFNKDKNKGKNDLVMIEMKYVDASELKDMVVEMSDKREIISIIFESLINNLTGVECLHKANVVHFDLKSNNILFDKETTHPYIIDFGLSIDIDQMKEIKNKTRENMNAFFINHSPGYIVWTPEVKYFTLMMYKGEDPTEEEVNSLTEDTMKAYSVFKEIFSDDFMKKFKALLNATYMQYREDMKEIPMEDRLNVFFDNILLPAWKTWDIHAMSRIYMQVVRALARLALEHDYMNNNLMIELCQLLLMNMHPDYRKRPNQPEEIIDEVERIYTTQNAETYDSFLGLQNGINMNVKERTIIEESITDSYDDERKSVMEMRN